MKLIDVIMDNSLEIDEGFILELEELDLLENIVNELELLEARNIATTSNENIVYVKSLKALREKARKIIKDAMKKNPKTRAELIAKVRYLTGRGKKEQRIKDAAKGIYKGGKPVEDSVYNITKADLEIIKKNEAEGKSKPKTLSPNQITYKASQTPGDYKTLTLTNLFAIKIKDKVYTVKSAEDKIEKYATDAAKVVVEARNKTAKICKEFGLKEPFIPKSEEEAKKYIIDVLIKPMSKAARNAKEKAKEMLNRKMAGESLPKNDYVIKIDSYRHGKVTVLVQLHLDKVVESLGLEGIKASEVPDSWSGTKAAWGKQVKQYKAEIQDKIESIAGPNATVSIGNAGGWITIRFTK